MYPYRVLYVESTYMRRGSDWKKSGKLDGFSTSKEIEALILEQNEEGYELVSITPLAGTIIASPYSINTTTGFIVTFKLNRTSD